jgi:3-dehydroquinate synthase
VIAFGGGVIGDLAGFAAASYMRGVPLIQVPTTLLSQVDSSVGGKVGIDLPEGKNLAGAFYPPAVVHICREVLDTLSERQMRNGMAEVWKYGFIMDPKLLPQLPPKADALQEVIRRCTELKAQIVEDDEYETRGSRAILNFGHTVGHAIEQVTGYGPVLHGEAISIGMVIESHLGERLGITKAGTTEQISTHLSDYGLPTKMAPALDIDQLVHAMRRDKKAEAGSLAFSLLTKIGECKLIKGVPEGEVRAALAQA